MDLFPVFCVAVCETIFPSKHTGGDDGWSLGPANPQNPRGRAGAPNPRAVTNSQSHLSAKLEIFKVSLETRIFGCKMALVGVFLPAFSFYNPANLILNSI